MAVTPLKQQRRKERWAWIGAVLFGLLALHLLAHRYFFRTDLTEQKIYTLSPATKKILAELKDLLSIRIYFSRELPPALVRVQRDVEDLLQEFRTYSQNNVRLEHLDPQQDPVTEQKVQMMGIPPVEVNVFKKDKAEVAKVYLGLAVHFGGKQEVLPLVQSAQNLEYQLAAAILKVTQPTKPTLGWWGERREDYQLLLDYLGNRFTLRELDKKSLQTLTPETIPALVMLVPEKMDQGEIEALQKYVEAGGKVILMVEQVGVAMEQGIRPAVKENPLHDWLATYGVTVRKDLVLDRSNAMATFSGGLISFQVPYPFWVQVRPEHFNADQGFVAQLHSLVLPWTSSLEIRQPLPKEVTVIPLFHSTPHAVALSELEPFTSLHPDAAVSLFEQNPPSRYPLGLLVEGKMILVGNQRFLQNNFLERFQENLVFLENAVDVFTTGEALIGIRSKGVTQRPLALVSDAARQGLKIFAMGSSPLLLLALGGIVAWRKKANAKRLREVWR